MILQIRTEPGQVYSVFSLLLIASNKEYFSRQITEQWNLEVEEDFLEDLDRIRNHKLFNLNELRPYFDIKLDLYNIFMDIKLLWDCQDLNDYFSLLEDQDIYTLRKRIIRSLDFNSSHRPIDLKEYLTDDSYLNLDKIFSLINKQALDTELKWGLFSFIKDPLGNIERFITLINNFLPIYYELKEKYDKQFEGFVKWIQGQIDQYGIDFINQEVDILELKQFKTVYLSYSYFDLQATHIDEEKNACYLNLGILFQKYVEELRSQKEVEKYLKIFRSFSDSTRFEIVKMLIGKECFGQEIADNLNISTATVSYHMDYLLGASLVKLNKKGRKIFYKIDKNKIQQGIKFLEKELKLS